MKSNQPSIFTRMVLSLLAGGSLMQLGSCTSQDVKAQFSNALAGVITNLVTIVVTDATDELFDVDD